MEEYGVRNYNYLDSKPYFASWEIDIFMVFATFFGLALMITNSFLSFSVITGTGILSAYIYAKIKKSKIKGFFWHLLYAFGIKQPITLPPSYMRIFVGA